MTVRALVFGVACVAVGLTVSGVAQEGGRRPGLPVPPLGAGPYVFDTAEQPRLQVTVLTRELSHPWAIAFLLDGSMLVTERPGRLRIFKNGVLDPKPVRGVPEVRSAGLGGLEDVALHPRFAENRLVYLTYIKPVNKDVGTPAVARGRFENGALVDVKDILVTDPGPPGSSAVNTRIAFGRDGMLYMSTGGNIANMAQDPASLRGKVLRLRDDGSVPDDNPFVGRAGYRPEIYTLGHRNSLALIVHPTTGDIWNNENGPNGGDEINVILPGKNYGWPLVSFGRDYPGPRVSEHPTREDSSRRSSPGFRRLRRRAWPSTPATSSRGGRATCSSAPCASEKSPRQGTCSGSSSTRRWRRSAASRCSPSSSSASAKCARDRTASSIY
jgi:glucose/arabinose dehydrogenase